MLRRVSLCLALVATTRASRAADAPVAPATPVESTPAAAPTEAPEKGSPAAAPVVGWDIDGQLIDPRDKLDAFVAALLPAGRAFVESGDADRVGTARIGTVPRLERAFHAIGYEAHVSAATGGTGYRLRITLSPYQRVRFVFVRGNWPLRQDEIMRRISIRAGQSVPPAGERRDELLASERDRIVEYLQAEGFRDARVAIELHPQRGTPAPLSLLVRIRLGPGYPIGEVKVSGNRALTAEVIEDQVRHGDWRWLWLKPLPFKSALLRQDLAELSSEYRDLGYPAARILEQVTLAPQRKEIDLALDVKERRKVVVDFEGNKCCSDSTLRDQLTFFRRGGYDEYEVTASEGALASGYHERGYMFVKVSHRTQHLSPQLDRVTYAIEEGPRLRVRGVAFIGNDAFDADHLGSVVSVKTFPLLGYIGLGSGGYASPRQLELDAENLVEFYRQQGFPDAEAHVAISPNAKRFVPIDQAQAAALSDPEWKRTGALHVRFTVHEGRRLMVDQIKFHSVGGAPLPRDEAFLKASLLTLEHRPLRESAVRDDEARLQRLMGDEGYPYAHVSRELAIAQDRATVTWNVNLGPRVRVGPMFVRGNFLTHDETVLRWIPLRPGAFLTTTAIERGQRNLALLQLFNNASPVSFPGEDERRETIPMLIQVEERHDHLGVFRVGGGISTEQRTPGSDLPVGGYASAGYEHRNLLGRGYTFLSSAAYGNSVTRARASLLDPRLFGTLFRLELAGTYLRQATVRLGDTRSGAASLTLRREMYPGLDAFVAYNLRDTFRTEFLVRGAGPDARQTSVRLGTLVGSMSVGFDWLRLDNLLIPTRGFKLHGDLEYADPAFTFNRGEDTFIKLHARSLVVVPILPWLSVRHNLRYEQGFPLRGASVLPAVERFFAGGDTSLRGYELDRARTEVVITPGPVVSLQEYRPLGGNLRILQNLELVFPLARPIYGAVFLDTGIVADSLSNLPLRDFRHSVGITPLLVRLPVGDISLSWAWPLDPGPGDARIGRIHFNVGLMF